MTSQDEITATRATVARLETDVDTLDSQISFFADLRAQKRAALDLARAALTSATTQAQERDREPQDASELQDALENLRRRIASAPARSHTAGQAQRLITFVTSPNCPLSTAERLSAIKDTLRTFRDGLQYSDRIHFGPDTWKS
jgi:chromosome segregation ATPase